MVANLLGRADDRGALFDDGPGSLLIAAVGFGYDPVRLVVHADADRDPPSVSTASSVARRETVRVLPAEHRSAAFRPSPAALAAVVHSRHRPHHTITARFLQQLTLVVS